MKKHFGKFWGILLGLALILGDVLVLSPVKVQASNGAQYEPLIISQSSLNGNIIWGRGESAPSTGLENGNSFYVNGCGYSGSSTGNLPDDGSLVVNGVPYQLAHGGEPGVSSETAYCGNDAIRLWTGGTTSRSMNLQTTGVYDKVYVYATAGGPGRGNYADFTVTLTYSDETTSVVTYHLYDWWDNRSNQNNLVPVHSDGRFKRYCKDSGDRGAVNSAPYIHSATIDADETKILTSITFNLNGSSSGSSNVYCGILAVTGMTPSGVPQRPVATAATDVNQSSEGPGFTANWELVEGATDYRIDISTDVNFTSFVGSYNNFNVGNDTSFQVTQDIQPDTTYFYRIRAVNSSGQSIQSNRIGTDIPEWVKQAGLTDEQITYDYETNTMTVLQDIELENPLSLPAGQQTTLNLNGYTITAPEGESAIETEAGDGTALIIDGNGTIVGSDGADTVSGNAADGNAAIDFTAAGSGSSITVISGTIIGGNGGNANGENSNGGNGAAGISGSSGTSVVLGDISGQGSTSANVIGGDGGNALTSGNGGDGGNGIDGNNITLSQGAEASGGDGGNGAANGSGGDGGNGVDANSSATNNGTSSGGSGGDAGTQGGDGGNGGAGINSSSSVTNNGSTSGGSGGDASGGGAGGNGGDGVSSSSTVTNNGSTSGGSGGTGVTGGSGGNGIDSSSSVTNSGTASGGDGGNGETPGAAGNAGANQGTTNNGNAGETGVFTITFDPNGGTTPVTEAVTTDSKLSSLPSASRSGMSFLGWYTEAEGGTKVSVSTLYLGNTTLYAHWGGGNNSGNNASSDNNISSDNTQQETTPQPTVSENTVSENTVSENTVSGNGTLSANASVSTNGTYINGGYVANDAAYYVVGQPSPYDPTNVGGLWDIVPQTGRRSPVFWIGLILVVGIVGFTVKKKIKNKRKE